MNRTNRHTAFSTSMALAFALFLSACGSSLTANSTRKILPEFRTVTLEHKHLLVAPFFATDVDAEGAYPVSQALMLEAATAFAGVEPELAMPMRLVRVGAAQVQSSFKERHQAVTVTTVPTERSLAFQAEPEHYLNVSVDGAARYLVPKPESLKAIGVIADYVIVVNGLHFGGEETYSSHNGVSHLSKDIRCKARFLVFGYTEGRVVAEGTVDAYTGYKGDPNLSNLDTLMGYIYEEIVAKPPFR